MRKVLQEGTWIRLSQGELYKITGKPIGEGGGSIVYPCKKISYLDGKITVSEIDYALKECFPLSAAFVFERREDGEIVSASEDPASVRYLDSVKKMQMQEQEITGKIYNTAARTIPVISASGEVELSFDEGHTFHLVNNTVTIMTSLESKGKALKSYLSQGEKFSVVQAFQIIKQVLFAVKEVHEAGFLHLDIQDGNVFIKGSLSEEDNLVSLVDFGAARPVCEDGLCPVIRDRALFSTIGFESPEIVGHNDGTLRLGAEADLYSVGYLLLLMLTGKRYTQRELDSANIGLYLSKRKLKKLNCPAHMADKVHQIISKALKKTPEERYHSCEEMLADVSDLIHALQPYKSDLSQVVYDAFICYRHGETDSQAAKILQQKLEHFHIPWMRKNKIKKIRRVFMDEGELSSCSDFGLQIREALKNSGWLIVICSSETKDSPWVNLEIKTFLEFHDRSRILAVVTEGEPEDVFQKELLGSDRTAEVLAADARGETPEQVLRNVKKNVLLKIAAPILGTTYDSLKQRQRNYIIKKYAVIGSLAVLMANAFFLFAMDRNHRIEEQNRRIMENRAEDQVALSAELLKEGNREEALQAALEAQEEGDTPVIPEEIYALNSALYSYHHEGNVEGFRPDRQVELENNTTDIGESSPDGKVFFCLDESGIAYFYNMEDWSLKWKCKLEEETSAFIDGKFVSEGKILLFSQNTVYYTDIEQQKCIKRIPLKEEDNMLETPVWALHDGMLVFGCESLDGVYVYRYDLNQDSMEKIRLTVDTMDHITSIAISPDGNTLAVSWVDYASGDIWDGGIQTVDLNTGKQTTLEANHVSVIRFISNSEFLTIECENVPFGSGGIDDKKRYREAIYQMEKGRVWENTTHYLRTQYEDSLYADAAVYENFQFDSEKKADVILVNLGTHLMIIDRNTYNILCEEDFSYPIVKLAVYNESTVLLGLADGSVERFWMDDRQKIFSAEDSSVGGFLYDANKKVIIQMKDGTPFLVISQIAQDTSMKPAEAQDIKKKIQTEKTVEKTTEGTRVQGASTKRFAVINDTSIDVYDGEKKEPFFTISRNGADEPLVAFFKEDEQLVVYCDRKVTIWDLASGKNIATQVVDMDSAQKTDILADPKGRYLALYTREGQVSVHSLDGWLERVLNIYSVDENSQLHPYADIPYAYVDLEKEMIYALGRDDDRYYGISFYGYRELREKAEQILGDRKEKTVDITYIFG